MATRDEQIGQNITRLRGDNSQQWVADRMRERGWKWAQATVWNLEKGERPLRLAEAEDLAEILRTEISRILESPETLGHEEVLRAFVVDVDNSFGKLALVADELLGQLGLLEHALRELPPSMGAGNYWVDAAQKSRQKTPERAVLRARAVLYALAQGIETHGKEMEDIIREYGSPEAWYAQLSESEANRGEHPEA